MDWQILLDAILVISTVAIIAYSANLRRRIKDEEQERRTSVNTVNEIAKDTLNAALRRLYQRLSEHDHPHEHPHEHEHIQHVHELEAASREITAGREVTVKRCRQCGMIFRDNASI